MKCPICLTVELTMAERQGVEIDYCPECRGIWLDRGELDKLIERSYSQIPQPVVPVHPPQQAGYRQKHHDNLHDSHGYGAQGNHKKKTWLSEIFD